MKNVKSFLVRDTTKKERQKIIDDSIALSLLDSPPPTEFAMELNQKYIEGELELEEIGDILLKHYKMGDYR